MYAVSGNREDADRQAVEPVGEVHGVGFGDEHEHGERQIPDAQIGNEALEERKDEPRVVQALALEGEQQDAD